MDTHVQEAPNSCRPIRSTSLQLCHSVYCKTFLFLIYKMTGFIKLHVVGKYNFVLKKYTKTIDVNAVSTLEPFICDSGKSCKPLGI